MELYYKDLISEKQSLEELVDDLMLIVQGADEVSQAASAHLEPAVKQELTTRLMRLKARCRQVEQRAIAGAIATGKLVRQYPYYAAGVSFGIGLLAGVLLGRYTSKDCGRSCDEDC